MNAMDPGSTIVVGETEVDIVHRSSWDATLSELKEKYKDGWRAKLFAMNDSGGYVIIERRKVEVV